MELHLSLTINMFYQKKKIDHKAVFDMYEFRREFRKNNIF